MIKRPDLRLQHGDRFQNRLENELVMIGEKALNGSKQLLLFAFELPTNTGLNIRKCLSLSPLSRQK